MFSSRPEKPSSLWQDDMHSPWRLGVQVLQASKGARVASMMSLSEASEDDYLVMLTKHGLIKRTPMKLFANVRGSLTAIKLRVGPYPPCASAISAVLVSFTFLFSLQEHIWATADKKL